MKKILATIFFICSLAVFGQTGANTSSNTTVDEGSTTASQDSTATDTSEVQWDEQAFENLQKYAARAKAIKASITESQAFDDIVNGKEITLPAKIAAPTGNDNYALIIDSINFTATKAYAVIYMVIKIPVGGEEKELVFVGDRINFTKNGGFSGEKILKLAKDVDFNVGRGSKLIIRSGAGDPNRATQVSFDCDGFQELSLAADVKFSRGTMIPVDYDGDELPGYVTGSFNTVATDWDDWMADISFDSRFQITNAPGFNIETTTIHYDHSDLRNPPSMVFPDGYAYDANDPLWRGFYIRNFDVGLPKAFFDKDSPNEALHIGASNIIIDRTGFSGKIYANPILAMERGRIGNWKYSIVEISIRLQSNSLVEAGFNGRMNLPISGEDKTFTYDATISKNDQGKLDYVFTVSNTDDLDFALWRAGKVEIHENSVIKIAVIQGRFSPEADLNGAMKIGVENSQGEQTFGATLAFEHLILKTSQPEVSIGPNGGVSFSTTTDDKSALANFPVQLEEVGIRTGANGNSLGLALTLTVNLQGEGDGGFGGSTSLVIWGKKDAATRRWGFDRVQMERIEVEVDNRAFKLNGYVEFFEGDQTYGKGFCGQIDAEFVEKFQVKVAAIFGKTLTTDSEEGFRYWYVDGAVIFEPAIPFLPAIGINGFSGGAYYRMAIGDPEETNVDCQSSQGMTYVPANGIGLGIKAGVSLVSIPTKELFNGEVTFEVNFNNDGGINRVSFYGGVQFFESAQYPNFSELSEQAQDSTLSEQKVADAALRVAWETYYDVPSKTFAGNFQIYVNVAGGLIKGSNGANKAGEIAIFISPQDWYLYVGKPAEMLGLDFAGIAKFNAYFCAGTKLPNPPMAPVPSQITDQGADDINDDLLGIGSGLAFGSRLSIEKRLGSDFSIKICRGWVGAEFAFIMGFDILLTKAQAPVECAQATDGVRGFNDWYAYGQAFAYLSARLGVDYNCGIKKGTWNLASFTAAILLQAQLPNPSYFSGFARVDIDLLGLIRLEKSIDIEFGDRCGANDPSDIRVIQQITPLDSLTDADVYTKPMVYLKAYQHKRYYINSQNVDVRVHIDEENVSLKCVSCDNPDEEIAGELKWNDEETQFMFMPFEALEGLNEYEFTVNVSLQQLNEDETAWIEYGTSGPMEEQSVTFFTGEEADNIPTNNIAYAYPLPNMRNFYKGESNQGYIKTLVLPHRPLRLPPGFNYEIRWKQGSSIISSSQVVEAHEDRSQNQFTFTIPTDELAFDKDYRIEIYKVPDANVTSGSGGSTTTNVESLVVAYNFHTSAFASFTEKMSKIAAQTTTVFDGRIQQSLSAFGGSSEGLSRNETEGVTVQEVETSEALVRLRTGIIPESFKTSIETIYGDLSGIEFAYLEGERSSPPLDAIYFENDVDGVTVSYDVPHVIMQDKAEATAAGNTSISWPEFPVGRYRYFLDYYLPGATVPVATVPMSFHLQNTIELH